MPGKCRFREAHAFGGDIAIVECCSHGKAYTEIKGHYQTMLEQGMTLQFSELIERMMEGKYKINRQTVIAIPVPEPDFYCQKCDFNTEKAF